MDRLIIVSLLFTHILLVWNDVKGQMTSNACYNRLGQPIVCIPGPQNMVRGRSIHVTPGLTCGSPPSGFCQPGLDVKCYVCNSSNPSLAHGPNLMTDNEVPPRYWPFRKPTWWQSLTWWDARTRGLLTGNILKVNLTLSFNKTFDITGKVKVTFYSSRPKAAVLVKSADFGRTWYPYRYFADNCARRFGRAIPTRANASDPLSVYCDEKQSTAELGSLLEFEPIFQPSIFWTQRIQTYVTATDLQIRLEYPWTDGNEQTNGENFLNKYYYDIADIRVDGRCHCNGHAPYCTGSIGNLQCDCRHNTEGKDCERCRPLYNNKPWRAAESSDRPNACELCTCSSHSSSCTYNATLGHGVCQDCTHNTTGNNCEMCKDMFYRNTSVSTSDPNTCLSCNCFPHGIVNNGSCAQNDTGNMTAGQCYCKPNIHGRTCDTCQAGFYGLSLHPVGHCVECNCTRLGTRNSSITCHQITGQCNCKSTVTGRTCMACQTGYYNFPNTTFGECEKCSCNVGGVRDDICNATDGKCLCRPGIAGRQCQRVQHNFYYPIYDQLTYEAETTTGRYSILPRRGTGFTGAGYARLSLGDHMTFKVTPPYTARFYINFRVAIRQPSALLDVQVHFVNNSIRLPMTTFQLNATMHLRNAFLQHDLPLELLGNGTYDVNITLTQTLATNVTYAVDSLVLIPDVRRTKAYTHGNSTVRHTIDNCWQSRRNGTFAEELGCRQLAFDTLVELQNGAKACSCNLEGSLNTSCDPYGGQCICKPGITGRQCNRCQPGYYNFSSSGCRACACASLGATNFLCNATSGQCSCKNNVVGRQCDTCSFGFYGYLSGNGCSNCFCNVNGSTSSQCNPRGQCPCKNSTMGGKCDSCRVNHFNFTRNGCSHCNCNPDGSEFLQCNQSGRCTCKQAVVGQKCNACRQGSFDINVQNPYGCQRCYCFGHSTRCGSLANLFRTRVQWNFNRGYGTWSVDRTDGSSTHNITSQGLRIRLGRGITRLKAPQDFVGFKLYLYTQNVIVEVIPKASTGSISESLNVTLNFTSVSRNSVTLTRAIFLNQSRHEILIHETQLSSPGSERQMQSILGHLGELYIGFSSNSGAEVTLQSVTLQTASRNQDLPRLGIAENAENCSCPTNYTGSSCQQCSQGYTRVRPNSGSVTQCVLCNCSGRSLDCDPETGICRNCRRGTEGEKCERCQPGVDGPDCRQCIAGYYGFNDTRFPGCRECNCELRHTLYGNNSICDPTSGQCRCKANVGGRRCDRCVENAANISGTCTACSECHRLIQVEVHSLRRQIQNLSNILSNIIPLPQSLQSSTFNALLQEANTDVTQMVEAANRSAGIENLLNAQLEALNDTFTSLRTTLNEVTSVKVQTVNGGVIALNRSMNLSATITRQVYDILWSGKYVLDVYINATVNKSSSVVLALQHLLVEMTTLKDFTQNRSTSSLSESKELLRLHQQSVNETQSGVRVINETRMELQNISASLATLNSSVMQLTSLCDVLHQNTVHLFTNITRLEEESTRLLRHIDNQSDPVNGSIAQLRENITAMEQKANVINNTASSVFSLIQTVQSNLLQLSERSSQLRSQLNSTDSEASQLWQRVHLSSSNATRAVRLSHTILQSMEETLRVVTNFNESMKNARASADQALANTVSVNESSSESLRNALTLKRQLTTAKNLSTRALLEMTEVNSLAKDLNSVISNLSSQANDLKRRMANSVYTISYSQQIRHNVSSVHNQTVQQITSTCGRVTNDSLLATQNTNHSNILAKNTSNEVSMVNKQLTNAIRQSQNIASLNATALSNLQDAIKRHRAEFNSTGVSTMLASLRSSLVNQSNDIKNYRQRINSLTDDIKAVKELVQQISTIQGCS